MTAKHQWTPRWTGTMIRSWENTSTWNKSSHMFCYSSDLQRDSRHGNTECADIYR